MMIFEFELASNTAESAGGNPFSRGCNANPSSDCARGFEAAAHTQLRLRCSGWKKTREKPANGSQIGSRLPLGAYLSSLDKSLER
jgi:hypothetical protein